jgi:hypothetical protein
MKTRGFACVSPRSGPRPRGVLHNRLSLMSHVIVDIRPEPSKHTTVLFVECESTAWLASELPNRNPRCCADGFRFGDHGLEQR